MPDEARKWLGYHDRTHVRHPAAEHLRRLLTANESQAEEIAAIKEVRRLEQVAVDGEIRRLRADNSSLVALVRVLRKWSYPNADIVAKNDAEAREAYQALPIELHKEIEDD